MISIIKRSKRKLQENIGRAREFIQYDVWPTLKRELNEWRDVIAIFLFVPCYLPFDILCGMGPDECFEAAFKALTQGGKRIVNSLFKNNKEVDE